MTARHEARQGGTSHNGLKRYVPDVGNLAQRSLARLPGNVIRPGRVLVLLYHSVHPSHVHASATPPLFNDHLRWLREHCDIIRLADVFQRVGRGDLRPCVAITFDDGFADNHSYALPALVRHEVQATFFITTGLVEQDPDVVARLKKVVNTSEVEGLTWAQISELRDAGMEIGAHTYSHPNLATLSEHAALQELSIAKDSLEQHLNDPIFSFAYPFGIPRRHFSEQTIRLAARVGYKRGAAVIYRNVRPSDEPLAIPRVAITGDSLQMLQAKVIGKLDLVGVWQEHAPRWATRLVSSRSRMRDFIA
jgi:peptidoglycan/xylan/chitin deacetylase (PgdA/CDA1 family)